MVYILLPGQNDFPVFKVKRLMNFLNRIECERTEIENTKYAQGCGAIYKRHSFRPAKRSTFPFMFIILLMFRNSRN